MNETIHIENFLGIKKLELKLNKLNILIGQPSIGKSVCAKLLFFFKSLIDGEIRLEDLDAKNGFERKSLKKFYHIFPKTALGDKDFLIKYTVNNLFIEVIRKKNDIKINCSPDVKDILKQKRFFYNQVKDENRNIIEGVTNLFNFLSETYKKPIGYNQYFIPAGRSFFANLQENIFQFIEHGIYLDPLVKKFGSFYSSIKKDYENNTYFNKKINLLTQQLLSGKYFYKNGKDFLTFNDGRITNVMNSSSGQQEVLPLIIILSVIPFLESVLVGKTIYIEEPEAHLFPEFQKLMVEFISTVYNLSNQPTQFFITTHSPYVLTVFNNLIQAGEIKKGLPKNKIDKLYGIVYEEKILNFEDVSAYSLTDKECKSLMCSETNLITTNIIDDVSNGLSIQFDSLLEMED